MWQAELEKLKLQLETHHHRASAKSAELTKPAKPQAKLTGLDENCWNGQSTLANLGPTSKIWNHPYKGSLQELLPSFDETKRKQLMLQT